MFDHLTDKDITGLVAIVSAMSVLFLLPEWQKLEYKIKQQINKKLAPHGLRLKERA